MEPILTLIMTVEADVIAYMICKWLDRFIQGGK